MSLIVRFVLIGEGTSDAGLVIPLAELCMLCGAKHAKEISLDWSQFGPEIGHTVLEKAKAALSQAPDANLLFIHRDADERDPTPRYEEIAAAMESLGLSIPYVAVVPVQETETWILLDEEAIRGVARNQRGRMRLNLPSPKQVENIANPKERLKEVLATASGLKGRKLQKFRQNFPQHRQKLLESLDLDGPISKVPAWQRLFKETCEAIEQLKRSQKD